jgi:CBS domain-containing protein
MAHGSCTTKAQARDAIRDALYTTAKRAHAARYMNCALYALQVFPDTLAGASRLYWNRLSPTARRAGVLHCCTAKGSRSMTTVAQLLKTKPNTTVYTIGADDSVYEAIRLMADKGIGALVVTDGDSIAGIITERDYARKVVLMDRSSKATPVREIMSKAVRFVRPDQTTDDCMALMTERRMRHLPVIENDRLIGMVSIGDLVKNIIAEQQFTIQQLEFYIHGERP